MSAPSLLVMAAGIGSRYGGLKQIDSIGPNGETIIDYSIYDAMRAGFGKVIFVIRREIEEQFRAIIGTRFEKCISVEYVFQELDMLPGGHLVPNGRTKPWGTTHAILMAAEAIGEPFAVINADDFYGAQSFRLLAQHLSSGSPDYAMVGFVLRNTLSDFGTVARGVCRVNQDGRLQTVNEFTKIERDYDRAKHACADGTYTSLTGDEVVSMNMWGFTPAIMPQLEIYFEAFLQEEGRQLNSECYIPSAINALLLNDWAKVRVLRTPDSWFGVTYRDDRPRVVEAVRHLIARGDYPEKLWTSI